MSVAQAKALLLKAVLEKSSSLTGIRPPNESLKASYQEMLHQFAKVRGGPLWFPYIGSGVGNGPFVELLDGSVKYDFISGIGPHFFGHSHPKIIEACIEASLSDISIQGHLQQNKEGLLLSEKLTTLSGLDHCFLTTSGAMANENALKIAFQKNHPRSRILAFERCFAGRTTTISQITDKPNFREGLPQTVFVDYIPFYNAEDPEGSTQNTLKALKNHLNRYPKQHALMCLELVQGEGGVYPGTKAFFHALLEVLKEHEIAIFIDEVQTFARTESLFAFQHFGLEEFVDIVSIGKISQIAATLFKKTHAPRPGLLSQTFTGSTSSLQVCLTLLDLLQNENIFGPQGKNASVFRYFSEKLSSIEGIIGPFGIGSMIGFTPFQGDAKKVTAFIHTLFEAGVITFLTGSLPTRVRMLPPAGILSFEDIDHVIEVINACLKAH